MDVKSQLHLYLESIYDTEYHLDIFIVHNSPSHLYLRTFINDPTHEHEIMPKLPPAAAA